MSRRSERHLADLEKRLDSEVQVGQAIEYAITE